MAMRSTQLDGIANAQPETCLEPRRESMQRSQNNSSRCLRKVRLTSPRGNEKRGPRSSALREPWKQDLPYLPNDLRNRRNLARGGYSSRPVPDLRGQARLRPPFTSFCTAGGDELARRGGSDRGGEVAGGPSCSTQPVEGRPVARRLDPRRRRSCLAGRPAPRLGGRAALGPSPISNVDSRAAVDRGAALPPAKKGEEDGSGKSQSVTSPWS